MACRSDSSTDSSTNDGNHTAQRQLWPRHRRKPRFSVREVPEKSTSTHRRPAHGKTTPGSPLSDDPFDSQSIRIAFNVPIALGQYRRGIHDSTLSHGHHHLTKGEALFDADTDPFRQAIPIPAQHAYLSAALHAELAPTLGQSAGDLPCGFTSGTTIILTNYRLCALTDLLMPGLESVLTHFTIPRDLQDIEQLTEHTVVTLEGTGSLQFTAQAKFWVRRRARIDRKLAQPRRQIGEPEKGSGREPLSDDLQGWAGIRIEFNAGAEFLVDSVDLLDQQCCAHQFLNAP